MSKSNVKRGPKPKKRAEIILKLREMKKATSAELEVATAYLDTLKRAGIIAVVDKAPKESRGRKPNVFALSPRGRMMALNLSKKAA
jgi:hypothetical protein